jgi:hypothetical protein
MGCDIHIFAEKRNSDGKYEQLEFESAIKQHYGTFGFLANIRNYAVVPALSKPRGLPKDIDVCLLDMYNNDLNLHSASWIDLHELISFNYDATFEDRRNYTHTGHSSCGSATCDIGKGEQITFRKFLHSGLFEDIKKLQEINADRIVFWFDN